MLAVVGFTSASDQSGLGRYTTTVPEGRLFINNGRVLRCDLFFSTPNADTVVAPKGSELGQSVPPVVWQYSGLLPVSDYLKTVAIHSVSSDDKIRPWQDVQHTFYSGLRVEGVNDVDAKIAYAGAYAFAPRWPLVEFTKVDEAEPAYPDTVLYSIEYIQPAMKGMSPEAYRMLALQILEQSGDVSLKDIRGVIDTADSSKVRSSERASLGGIGDANPVSNVKVTQTDALQNAGAGVVVDMPEDAATEMADNEATSSAGVKFGSGGSVVHSENHMVGKIGDDKLFRKAEKVAEPVSAQAELTELAETLELAETTEMITEDVKAEAAANTDVTVQAEILSVEEALQADSDEIFSTENTDVMLAAKEEMAEEEGELAMAEVLEIPPITVVSKTKMPAGELFYDDSEAETTSMESTASVSGGSDNSEDVVNADPILADRILVSETEEDVVVAAVGAEELSKLDGPGDEWVTLPDGTLVLRDINKMVSEK